MVLYYGTNLSTIEGLSDLRRDESVNVALILYNVDEFVA